MDAGLNEGARDALDGGELPMSDLVAAALDYAALGWAVFPCSPKNKQPLVEHGFKAASTDPETIKAWLRKWPNAMLAVVTGAASRNRRA